MVYNIVTIPLKAYNELRDENADLTRENNELNAAINELQEASGQKVIIRETCTCEDEGGEECVKTTTLVKGFDDVKTEVEDFYKKKFADLEEKIKDLDDENMETNKTMHKLIKEKIEAGMEVSRLKHRNLWQRIWNK